MGRPDAQESVCFAKAEGAGLCIAQSLNTNTQSFLGRMGWIVSVFPDLRDRLEAGEEVLIFGDCLLNIPTVVVLHSNQADRSAELENSCILQQVGICGRHDEERKGSNTNTSFFQQHVFKSLHLIHS